jgi:hypothetical protein
MNSASYKTREMQSERFDFDDGYTVAQVVYWEGSFGFARDRNGVDYFVSQSQLPAGLLRLQRGTRIRFLHCDVVYRKSHRRQAIQVSLVRE